MQFIVQENIFRKHHYDMLLSVLDRYELQYTIVRAFPFVDKIVAVCDIPNDFNVDDLPTLSLSTKNVFVFGSVKLARISSNMGYLPGSMYNDNHDYEVYSKYYGDNLLNSDSVIIGIRDTVQWNDGEKKFFRPCKDTKVFTGKVFTKAEWKDFSQQRSAYEYDLIKDARIQCSSVKRIFQEIRFWIVDGKVSTASTYIVGGEPLYKKYIDDEATIFVRKMVDVYKPAGSFVMDVCLTEDGWKIVEINCINCAGFYDCDISKLVQDLYETYNFDKH